jgi:hypothetical protein
MCNILNFILFSIIVSGRGIGQWIYIGNFGRYLAKIPYVSCLFVFFFFHPPFCCHYHLRDDDPFSCGRRRLSEILTGTKSDLVWRQNIPPASVRVRYSSPQLLVGPSGIERPKPPNPLSTRAIDARSGRGNESFKILKNLIEWIYSL